MPSSKARLVANLASGSTFANAIIDNVNANTFAARFPALGGDLQNTEGSNTVTLRTSGVTAGTYGNTTAIPVITVDAKGRITSATTNSVSGVTGVSYTAANSTITVSTSTVAFSANIQTANSSVQGLIQVVDSVANLSTTVAASANSVKNAYDRAIDANTRASSAQTAATSAYSNAVTYAGTIAATAYSNAVSTASADATSKAATAYSNAVTYAASNTYVNTTFAPKAAPTFTGTAAFADVTISGNLTTSGTTTYVNTTNLNVGDNIVTLNADVGAVAPTENAGIEINRGTSANVALRWNETSDKWETTVDGTTYLTVATNNDVSTAYSNAITYSGNAALAYANAVTYAGTIAATAYSNATSTAATDASTKAATAYSNATTYAATIAGTAYSNATTYAATIAGTAYSNAVTYAAANSYVNTQLGLKASLSGATFSGAVSGITTLAAGNTTITGFANVSSTLQVTGAVTMANTLAVTGTSTFTGLITGTVTSANNADYLDGQHGSYYAANSQLANYLPLAGGTMTGAVTSSVSGGAISLTNTTSSWITFPTSGAYAVPSTTTRSTGTKIVLFPGVTATTVDYGIGVEASHVWFSADSTSGGFKWYSNTTNIMTANTTGLNMNTRAINGVTTLATGNTTITGFANVSSTLQVTGTSTLASANYSGTITSTAAAGTQVFDLATNDGYASMRVIRNNKTGGDGMYIGYGNAGSGTTNIYGGGSTSGALVKYSTYTYEPGSFRAPIFYDSDNTSYYVDPASTSSLNAATFAGAVSGITTLAAGNTSISGYAYVSNTVYSYTDSGTIHYTHLCTGSFYQTTGAILIHTNIPGHNQAGNGNMFAIRVVGYGYNNTGNIDMMIGCYAGENNFYSTTLHGVYPSSWRGKVYVSTNASGKVCFRLGDVSTDQVYELAVTEFIQGFSTTVASYARGWSMQVVGTLPTLTNETNISHNQSIGGYMSVSSSGLLPGVDATYNLGSTTYRWNNIYTADAHFSNEGTEGNSVDGTTGNWTLQEGEDFIYMLNNKTGKRYKIKMEEV